MNSHLLNGKVNDSWWKW